MYEKGLSQLPSPVKVFIISYIVLIASGLLLSLWIVIESPVLRGVSESEQIKMLEDAGLKEEAEAARGAQFYSYLKLAHIHHLGHIFMVFSLAGIYAFVRGKKGTKTQVITWTTIVTLLHTLGFLMYSKIILIVFGSVYGILLGYMMVVIAIDCYKPMKDKNTETIETQDE